jgi:hypothetical protein
METQVINDVLRKRIMKFNFCTAAMAFSIFMPAYAYDSSGGGWQFDAGIYMWATSINGETSAGDDFDIGFDDVWNNLNFALMGWTVARNGNWLVFGDIDYADLQGDDNTTAKLVSRTIKAKLDYDVTQWIINAGGGYTVSKSDRHMLDVITGIRYFYQDYKLTFDLGSLKSKVDDSADSLDAIIGVNSYLDLNGKWYLNTYLDAGTGESKFTWQGKALLGYQFNSVDVLFGYRHVYWNFDGSKGLGEVYDDVDFSGPIIGAAFKF